MDAPITSHDELAPDGVADLKTNGIVADDNIDVDSQRNESDARHEPLPVKSMDVDDASDVAQVGIASDSNTPADHEPNGTAPEPPDIQMSEEQTFLPSPPTTNGINGTDTITADDGDAQTPAASIVDSIATSTHTTPVDDHAVLDDEDKPPPAKRPRVHSDADLASIAHSATPPPISAVTSNGVTPAPLPTPSPSSFDVKQFRFCQSTIKSLKKLKDAAPFLRPVDPVKLNIPHYPSIVKNPMDFSTIERKLASSNPTKPDPNPNNPRYNTADEFIADVRLIFSNCMTFNGPDHAVSLMGKRVEEVFDKQIKHFPTAEPKATVKKVSTPPPVPPPPAKKLQPLRRASTSVPVIRRSDTETTVGRPKREIHPPPPKDLPYADAPKKTRKSNRVKDDGTSEQLKFCGKLLNEMFKKQHSAMAYPFYEPVDWVKLDLPTYPKLIKKPMDLSTMRKKLDNHEYSKVEKFFDDFKLMIRNCFNFNPAGTPVNQAGIELQRFFDERWKQLPPIREASDEEEEEEEDDSDEERTRTIAMMESQIETMRGNIAALKTKATKEKKKKEKREKVPATSTSRVASGGPKTSSSSKKKAKKPGDDDVFTFDQKKDLSEAISNLEGSKLERVIQIIHEGVPEIRDSTEEIELEIDLLPPKVLTKLYNFVIRPLKPPTTKRNRPGKGTGTGGLKRKSMDEDVEAEKIRQLEQRMKLFEQGGNGGYQAAAGAQEGGSDGSSDSSSASESSGSDSE